MSILTVVGVINDPTTTGLSDSERAMGYDELG
ncbi:TPA: phage holin [Streptococcus suis]